MVAHPAANGVHARGTNRRVDVAEAVREYFVEGVFDHALRAVDASLDGGREIYRSDLGFEV